MARISPEDKAAFQAEVKELNLKINEKKQQIAKLEKEMEKDDYGLNNYYHISVTNENLEIVKINIDKSKLSEKYLSKKSDDFLNDGRKIYFKALIEMEKFLGSFVDDPLNENQEILQSLPKMDPKRVLNLVNKFRDQLTFITESYGQNTKYTWSFVDMEARYICIYKNLLDWRKLSVNDPRDPYFVENTQLLHTIKLNLLQISNKLREKYLIATKEVVDIKLAINFQEALRKVTSLIGPQEDAETCKKTIDSWKAILEKEEEMKKKKAKEKDRKKGKKKK